MRLRKANINNHFGNSDMMLLDAKGLCDNLFLAFAKRYGKVECLVVNLFHSDDLCLVSDALSREERGNRGGRGNGNSLTIATDVGRHVVERLAATIVDVKDDVCSFVVVKFAIVVGINEVEIAYFQTGKVGEFGFCYVIARLVIGVKLYAFVVAIVVSIVFCILGVAGFVRRISLSVVVCRNGSANGSTNDHTRNSTFV